MAKAFKGTSLSAMRHGQESENKHNKDLDPKYCKIEDYIAQEIARE